MSLISTYVMLVQSARRQFPTEQPQVLLPRGIAEEKNAGNCQRVYHGGAWRSELLVDLPEDCISEAAP